MAPLEVTGRLDRLRGLFAGGGDDGQDIGALLVTTPANIRWLSGFSGSAGLLLVTGDGALLTTDGRYRTQSAEQLRGSGAHTEVTTCVGGVQAQREALVERSAGVGSLGLEADTVTWSSQRTWAGLVSTDLVPTLGALLGFSPRLAQGKALAEVS